MASIEVAIWNASTVLADADIAPAVKAFQTQVSRDFAPVWGADTNLTFVPKGPLPKPGSWWLAILDQQKDHVRLLRRSFRWVPGKPVR